LLHQEKHELRITLVAEQMTDWRDVMQPGTVENECTHAL
jgi:hypothetical protein